MADALIMQDLQQARAFVSQAAAYGVLIQHAQGPDVVKRPGVHVAPTDRLDVLIDALAWALEHGLSIIYIYSPTR